MRVVVVLVSVLLGASLIAALKCSCEGDFIDEQHEAAGPLLTPDDERRAPPAKEPGTPVDIEGFSMPGNTSTGDGPTSCICKRQRRPIRPIKCNKKGLEEDKPDPECEEEILLDPEVGKPAIRLVIKIGIRPTIEGSTPLGQQVWYDTWTATFLTILSLSTGVDVEHMSVVGVNEIPQTVDFQIIARNERAADIVIQSLNRAIDSLAFDAQVNHAGYPGNPTCRILSIRAYQIQSYNPSIHRLLHFPRINKFRSGGAPIPRFGNHTIGNHTAHVGLLAAPADVQRKIASLVKLTDDVGEEQPLMLKSIAATFESQHDKEKVAPVLRIPILVRPHITPNGGGVPDSPEQIHSVETVPEMATAPTLPAPVIDMKPKEESILERIARLQQERADLDTQEKNILEQIRHLEEKKASVEASLN